VIGAKRLALSGEEPSQIAEFISQVLSGRPAIQGESQVDEHEIISSH